MEELIPTDQEWDASRLDGGINERKTAHRLASVKTKNVPDAASCSGARASDQGACLIENQYCPPHVPGSSGVGFRCCSATWTAQSAPCPGYELPLEETAKTSELAA